MIWWCVFIVHVVCLFLHRPSPSVLTFGTNFPFGESCNLPDFNIRSFIGVCLVPAMSRPNKLQIALQKYLFNPFVPFKHISRWSFAYWNKKHFPKCREIVGKFPMLSWCIWKKFCKMTNYFILLGIYDRQEFWYNFIPNNRRVFTSLCGYSEN